MKTLFTSMKWLKDIYLGIIDRTASAIRSGNAVNPVESIQDSNPRPDWYEATHGS